jgi:hypothetical protein
MTIGSSRRGLVLSSEGAGHPFRRSLPPGPGVPDADQLPAPRRSLIRTAREDWRSLLNAYCATLVVVSAFIA